MAPERTGSNVWSLTLDPERIDRLGHGLARPENVLGFRDGTVFTSSNKGYITRINPDGEQLTFGQTPGGAPTTMALDDSDNALLTNDTGDGRIYRLFFDGRHELVLREVGGRPIGSANFVIRDDNGRVWVAVATRRAPPHDVINVQPDGYIALIDTNGEARIVADGLFWPNEIRFDREQNFAYVPETFGRRITRFEVLDDGTLTNGRPWGPDPISETSAPDGIAIDEVGNVWVAIVSRNGLVIIDTDEQVHTVFEDPNEPALAEWLHVFTAGRIPMSQMRALAGQHLQLPTSVAFAGDDLKTVVMGSLAMESLLTFRSPVAGLPLAHQHRDSAPPRSATSASN